jgi:hypothetical protein
MSAIERPLLVKPDVQGLSRETSISRGGFTPGSSRWGKICLQVCNCPKADHHRRRTVLNSIDNKRRLARGDHGEDSPVRRAELEQQLMAAEFECRYAMDDDRDSAADWRDSLRRQLDELKPVEDE